MGYAEGAATEPAKQCRVHVSRSAQVIAGMGRDRRRRTQDAMGKTRVWMVREENSHDPDEKVALMDAVSRVLIQLERFSSMSEYPPRCPICRSKMSHEIDCLMDLALSERGFHSAADRDAARERIKYGSTPTIP